jgi:hypothetical protein
VIPVRKRTVPISPYRSIGNDKPWKPAAYQHVSNPSARMEATPAIKLFWHGLPGGLFLLGLAVVATLVVVVISPAASDAPTSAHNVSQVEARAGGKVLS